MILLPRPSFHILVYYIQFSAQDGSGEASHVREVPKV